MLCRASLGSSHEPQFFLALLCSDSAKPPSMSKNSAWLVLLANLTVVMQEVLPTEARTPAIEPSMRDSSSWADFAPVSWKLVSSSLAALPDAPACLRRAISAFSSAMRASSVAASLVSYHLNRSMSSPETLWAPMSLNSRGAYLLSRLSMILISSRWSIMID